MNRRAGLVVGLLALDFLVTGFLLLGRHGLGDAVIACVGIATLARVALSVAWIKLSESIPRAISVTVVLLGLEALTFVYLYFPGRLAPTDDQEWAHAPLLMASFTFGPALLLLLILLLIARGSPGTRRE